jgi:ABC-type transporter Mla subunit MlaD
MFRSLAAVLVLTAALVAAGCGSSEPEPMTTADWADAVCTDITTWESSITTAADSLKGGSISEDSLKSAADDVTSATETLESDLKDLGKPDAEVGQQAKDSLDQLSTDLKTGADSINTAVDDASGVSGVVSAATTVTTTLETMGNQVSSTITSLKQLDPQGEIETAFQQSSACQQLSSSS